MSEEKQLEALRQWARDNYQPDMQEGLEIGFHEVIVEEWAKIEINLRTISEFEDRSIRVSELLHEIKHSLPNRDFYGLIEDEKNLQRVDSCISLLRPLGDQLDTIAASLVPETDPAEKEDQNE